jgi:hypothetical protein
VLEQEANFFAAEFLAPLPILKKLEIQTAEQIKELCHLSGKAATNRENDLKSDTWWNTYSKYVSHDVPDEDLYCLFDDFLSPVTFCINPAHWNSNSVSLNAVRTVKILSTQPLYAPTGENGRFISCPQCGNEHFSEHAKFCKACGTYLFNKNINRFEEGIFCGQSNPSDACYCEYCGTRTLLTYKGLAELWSNQIKPNKMIIAG